MLLILLEVSSLISAGTFLNAPVLLPKYLSVKERISFLVTGSSQFETIILSPLLYAEQFISLNPFSSFSTITFSSNLKASSSAVSNSF